LQRKFIDVKTTQETIYSLHFTYLPAYAQYLLEHKLEEFTEAQHTIARQLNIPLLQAFKNMPQVAFKAFITEYSKLFLNSLASNKGAQYIQDAIQRWTTNNLPNLDKHQIVTEDLSLITFARKKALLQFLPTFCKDAEQLILIVEELDYFFTRQQAATTEIYIQLLQEKIAEHTHLIEKINTTSPSAIYVFDLIERKTIYTNGKFNELLSYTADEIQGLEQGFFNSLIHPDDKAGFELHYQSFGTVADKQIQSCKYRIKNKDGHYLWMRNYDTVFKRKDDNSVWQIIGVVIDVTKEKTTADELRKREKQLTEAQALAHIGSWSLLIETGEVTWSDEMYQIYELDKSIAISLPLITSLTHPEDEPKRKHEIGELLRNQQFRDFHYRILTTNNKIKYIHATAEVLVNEQGVALELFGTAQDITEQQNLIDQLQRSEKLYKQAQSLAHIGNWTKDLITGDITWSEELYSIYEIPPSHKLSTEEWHSMIHPDEREEVITYWEVRFKDKQPYDKIHRVVLQNGKIKTLHRKGEFIFNSNGEAIKLVGTTQDITEQYKIQQELKEQQTFIQKITDATPSIITSYRVHQDKYAYVSEGLQKLLGYQPIEALSKGATFFVNLVHPDDVAPLNQQMKAALQHADNYPDESKVVEYTYRMRHKNGHYRWLTTYETVFDRNASGKVEQLLRISLDVTDHTEARKKIEEQELFIKQLADASPTILYLYNTAESRFSYINQEIFYVLGYTPEEVIELNEEATSLLYHPEDISLLPERKESNKRFQHTNSMIQYECRLKSKGGEWCWFVIREVIFKKEKGTPVQILGAALDITKRKEMEKALVQNTYQLQQSNASLEEFAYVASHDLKEPLRKISTFGDRLIHTQQEGLTDDGKLYLKKIIDSSQRMQMMINDLLSISMITGDRSYQPCSLQQLFDEVKQTLEHKIEKHNAIIESRQLPEANIVASQFRQLFQNLLSNSLKFTRPGVQPRIEVDWKYIQPEEIKTASVTKANRYLQLDFSDNGIGFEDEYAGKIFQIFQRLHGRSEYEGTGIGLAICKKIVEHHEGFILAHGTPGVGATFTIYLPA
jgi:PAS domain S-box-containing protein